jgi:hypothetical protein
VPPSGELYIRYSATDHGERDIPAGTEYYLSPAIEILGSGLGPGTARADTDQTVRVYVGNQGANAHTDVNVQVYCTDWGTSSGWMQSLGGPAGREVGPLTVVGNAKWETNSEGVFDVNWHPVAAELNGALTKHVCLFANVYRPGDGGAQSNPPVFSVPTNQHHAQRNITLAAAILGSKIHFVLQATSMVEEGGVFLLEVAETPGRLDPIDARQLAGTDWFREAQGAIEGGLPLHKRAADVRLEAEGQTGRRLKLELEPGKQVPVVLGATPARPKEPGLHRFSIVQRSARTGEVVAGARLLVATAPEKLIPEELLKANES